VRACAIEVVWRWLGLVQPPGLPHQQQLQAMEALTIYCPLGHALGLGGCSAALEDTAIQVVLFGGLFQWMCIVACGGLCCGLFQGDVVHHGSGWRMAMEALTLYWPLGRALGLVGCSAALVDAAFKAGTGRRGVCGVGSFSVMLCVLA
jgi:hypothetical protein